MNSHSPFSGNAFPRISYNFEIAKVVAILVVAVAHFFSGSVLWVPATMGLFLFGFSSAFFTALKYQGGFSKKKFWKNKFSRLGYKLLVINGFLFVLFWLQEKEGIFTWQTLVHLGGWSGVLNWFAIDNPSPFGRGLWFFTLLILFYISYPVLENLSKSKNLFFIVNGAFIILASILHNYVQVGHMLWLTATGFVCGVLIVKVGKEVPVWLSGLTIIVCSLAMVFVTFGMQIRQWNFYFIFFISLGIVLWLIQVELPRNLFLPFTFFSGCLLEIYIIHTYLMVEITGYRLVDLFLSITLIVAVAMGLEKGSMQINKMQQGWMGTKS